ncbi:hypothetical protein QYZ87_01755 [Porphyromonadaceae bacterium W3.11]|nr:hypothetical protein [Porphyromonadaceae bacterium W3.11]
MNTMDTKRLLNDALSPYTAIASVMAGITVLLWLVIIMTMSLSAEQRIWGTVIMISLCLIIFLVYEKTTKKLQRDRRNNDVELIPIEHSDIFVKKEAVAGSGAMYIPILGRLFPKLWGPKMTIVDITYANGLDGKQYRIIQDANKGEQLYKVEGRTSNVHLGFVLL